MTESTLTKGRGVSKVFGTTLADLPLFQGTSAGVRPVEGHQNPWPHENLHQPHQLNDDGTPPHDDNGADLGKDYYMLPDNTTAARITKFHNFCLEMPDVMCNYCSITLYPEVVKWVEVMEDGGGAACGL